MPGEAIGPRLLAVLLFGLLALLSTGGCGSSAAGPMTLPGERVARMAEAQLEEENPGMSPGTMVCPDLDFEVGATTRCTRTAKLTGGRRVRVLGTIEVTGLADGGDLHVRLDDDAVEFGLDGAYLEDRLGDRIGDRIGKAGDPSAIACPYLVGRVGAAVICTLTTADGTDQVRVVVEEVDPASYDVGYRFEDESLDVR